MRPLFEIVQKPGPVEHVETGEGKRKENACHRIHLADAVRRRSIAAGGEVRVAPLAPKTRRDRRPTAAQPVAVDVFRRRGAEGVQVAESNSSDAAAAGQVVRCGCRWNDFFLL